MKQNSHHLFDQQFTKLFKNRIETRIIKNIFKNERVCIYIKTEKAQEQDGFGNKMKYHFHIKNLHKYTQLE